MGDDAAATATPPVPSVGERGEPDKSPRVANSEPAVGRAELSNYDIVRHYFTVAADRLKIADDVRAVPLSPYREMQVQVPVRLSDGKVHVFAGYRVQHNGARGPYKGGVRYHSEVDLDEVRGAGDADDLEDRDRRNSVRRRQGRDQLPGRQALKRRGPDELGTIMRRSYREVMAKRKDEAGVSLRVAAYELGVDRVLEAARTRGYI